MSRHGAGVSRPRAKVVVQSVSFRIFTVDRKVWAFNLVPNACRFQLQSGVLIQVVEKGRSPHPWSRRVSSPKSLAWCYSVERPLSRWVAIWMLQETEPIYDVRLCLSWFGKLFHLGVDLFMIILGRWSLDKKPFLHPWSMWDLYLQVDVHLIFLSRDSLCFNDCYVFTL